jgi:hypothetical protein
MNNLRREFERCGPLIRVNDMGLLKSLMAWAIPLPPLLEPLILPSSLCLSLLFLGSLYRYF